jgi:calcineurin-like phosphoesterase family protein
MIYFTSDLHFNHDKIRQYMPHTRGFPSVEKMNVAIIDSINLVCTEKDDLYILGDVTMNPRDSGKDCIRALRPKLHLIRGNHDYFSKTEEEELFETVHDYKIVKDNKRHILCFHFPIEEWEKCQYGRIHLHGHCHGNLKRKLPNRFDIGWDIFKRPTSRRN